MKKELTKKVEKKNQVVEVHIYIHQLPCGCGGQGVTPATPSTPFPVYTPPFKMTFMQ
jgi:hypothetical protein